jgi:hypothetical protein
MRIFTLLAICTFITPTLFSQQKGNIFISGTIGFSKSKTKDPFNDYKQTSFAFRPSIGKFYKSNRMMGISFNYYHSKYMDSLRDHSYGAGFFLRQYQPLGKSFFLFAEEGINGYSSKYNYPTTSPGQVISKERSINLSVYPGLAYAVNKRLQLELGLPQLLSVNYVKRIYNNKFNQPATESKYEGFSVDTGFNEYALGYLTFGVQWRIGKN